MVLDQRKGVSVQAIRGFIKQKYTTVDETRLKMMLRRTLLKGLESGIFVRPANSTMTGAQGRFRVRNLFKQVFINKHLLVSKIFFSSLLLSSPQLAVRKPQPVKSKEAKGSTNPINKDNGPKAKAGELAWLPQTCSVQQSELGECC